MIWPSHAAPLVLDELVCIISGLAGAAAAGAAVSAEEPPENQPPTAWPMEDPTATPLRVC